MNFDTLEKALLRQSQYSEMFIPSELTSKQLEDITKNFALAMHGEVSEMMQAVNLKDHRRTEISPNRDLVLYKSVDIFRYCLAMLNLWKISSDEFLTACEDKDDFLHSRHQELENQWSKEKKPVIIVDVDDVLAEFRDCFNQWLEKTYQIKTDSNDETYYNSVLLLSHQIDPESAFKRFISEGGFRDLPASKTVPESLAIFRSQGYYIQLLTARRLNNFRCLYDTHHWLKKNGIVFDSIAFSGEKYLWLTGQEFYSKVAFAIDDSSKHAMEYASHGIVTIMPAKSYNKGCSSIKDIDRFNFDSLTSEEFVERCLNSSRF
jgi:hypothetical protein